MGQKVSLYENLAEHLLIKVATEVANCIVDAWLDLGLVHPICRALTQEDGKYLWDGVCICVN